MPDRLAEIRNVKDFGAVGDGSHDDTTSIQAAFDAAFGTANDPHDQGPEPNKAVYFPAGNYKITAPLRITKVRTGRIFGDGQFASSIVWSGNGYNGNTLGGNANPNLSCMLEANGLARAHLSDLGFSFSNSQSKNTACVYTYTNITSTSVDFQNVCFAGATYGVVSGPASPNSNNTSEYHYTGCTFTLCGTAGVILSGANTLNHNFVNCSISNCGNSPITSRFTGSISGTTLTVSSFSSSADNLPLAEGMLIYDADGDITGGTIISSFGSGSGGTGMYTLNKSQTVSSKTMFAMSLYFGGIVNINGSAPFIAGCDMSQNAYDVVDFSSNNVCISGIRSESYNFIQTGAGTAMSLNACSIRAQGGIFTCTSTGPILHVNSVISGGIFPGFYVYGTDGSASLPETGGQPPVTRILKQISGSFGGTGDYLMDQSATPGNLGSCTVTAHPCFGYLVGAGMVSFNDCNPPYAVIAGSNNSSIRIRNNGFNPGGTRITPDLLKGFFGRVLEYDVVSADTYTVATLPTAHARFKGVRMFVTDSTVAGSGNFGATVAGGGSNTVPVYCDGSNWKIG
jgi:hypothetical protein